jgi:hypothetical protein
MRYCGPAISYYFSKYAKSKMINQIYVEERLSYALLEVSKISHLKVRQETQQTALFCYVVLSGVPE